MKKYPLFKVHAPTGDILKNVKEVLDGGFINEGVQVTELTKQMSETLEAQNLILVNSCTSALTLALHLAGVNAGDDVISTPMTCVATNTPIVTRGANIIWADVDPSDGMIDPEDVQDKITPNTKAIMAVAWAGTPPELSQLRYISEKKGIPLILDAAHAFGANFQGFPVHTWPDFTCYSLQAIKHVTTGDGGVLVCSNDSDYKRSKALKWFGLDRDAAKDDKGNWKGQQWDVDILEAGYKFNMNNISAAIGLAQMPYVNSLLLVHKTNAERYDRAFNGCRTVRRCSRPIGADGTSWVYTMKVENSSISRDELLVKLNAEGIMAGVVHVPNHHYTAFRKFYTDLPGVDEFSSKQFPLPCGWWLLDEDVEHIARRVMDLTK